LLEAFEFESAKPQEVSIDDTMSPTVEGYDISFQNFASDGIRLRWAYLLSLLEVAGHLGDRHPGLLILDEPGQQGVEHSSLASLYRVVTDLSSSGQILLTTSEPASVLAEWFANGNYQLIDLQGERLRQPIA
jgi:hypothetical protein